MGDLVGGGIGGGLDRTGAEATLGDGKCPCIRDSEADSGDVI